MEGMYRTIGHRARNRRSRRPSDGYRYRLSIDRREPHPQEMERHALLRTPALQKCKPKY